jgi:chemotaxis protein MotB
MALSRRNGGRFEANIWPGFVDAMTALLLVLMFVLSIFMIVQFMLSETITSQDSELDQLSDEVRSLAEALGLEQRRGFSLEEDVDRLDTALREKFSEASAQAALIATLTAQTEDLTAQTEAQAGQIAGFEAQVAGLLQQRTSLQDQIAGVTSERDAAQDEGAALSARLSEIEAGLAREITEKEAAQIALSQARDEIDESAQAARLDAARRDALQALVADLQAERAELQTQTAQQAEALGVAEQAKLVDAAAAQALRERLENADAELTAMSLTLEEKRREAEDTLTLLAAANAAREDLDAQLLAAVEAGQQSQILANQSELTLDEARAQIEDLQAKVTALEADGDTQMSSLRAQMVAALAAQRAAEAQAGEALSQAQQREILLATANRELSQEKATSAEAQRRVEALNQQIAALRSQLGSLQGLLDVAEAKDEDADVEIQALGSRLNAALAQVVAEQRRVAAEQTKLAEERQARLELEAAERARLEAEQARLAAEANELQNYRSEFFGQIRALLGDQDGVRIEGDRFVFASEVLFQPASATLSEAGRAEVANVASILARVAQDIPDTLDWVIRVDGHTDSTPLSGTGRFRDNWELSQARALSVVRYMSENLGIPPTRLAANGFGEFQPIAQGDSPEALAQNRRIEMKLTER